MHQKKQKANNTQKCIHFLHKEEQTHLNTNKELVVTNYMTELEDKIQVYSHDNESK